MQTINCKIKSFFHLYFLSLLFITCNATQNSSSSIISRFQEYLQINTAYPNPKYYEAVDFILSQAKSLSLESQTVEFVKDKPLVLLKWPGKNPKLPSVLLNSHTDVVPAEPHKWAHHPFSAHIDSDGNIYARGSQGFVMNLQPYEAEAGFDIRVPPTADLKSLEKRIAEEWAPASRNMTFEFIQKDPFLDKFGRPILTVADSSNPWWSLFKEAIQNAGGKLEKPEILLGATDASFFRQRGLPAIGFSAIANTPDRVHDHNEFLNQEEYLKGVDIYASIIKAYASYAEHTEAKASNYEL